ncbi:Golgi-associated plant pathogenesis-related protein 1 [Orchesella cincta]|uniref:Golgi-associated plant pathogenesis-related protein 1 n=1 Tax=Orchesella cincta TaxID=48709 RepID=A0A1D2MJ23_ORCCI|nr:Golgi-associated plant pathogenesis-related protein 1 [Orchesella cincta]
MKRLSVLAKKCAEFHMMENDGDRECPYKNGDGEIWLMGTDDWKKSDMAGKAAEKWYKQNENYDFTKPGYSPTTGAFTQLIWKSSEKLGFGFAQMKGKTVAVGIFSPGGNVKGMFPENVAAP